MSEVESPSEESPSPELTLPRSGLTTDDARDRFDDERQLPPREGLPPAYRMRAERHYVDFLADETTPASREQSLETGAIDAPGELPDPATLGPLTESIKAHGLRQRHRITCAGDRDQASSGGAAGHER